MGVTLVTDSTCDLPHEMCAARGIEVSLPALLDTLLNIKPVMMGSPEGKLVVAEKVRGQQKALRRALDILGEAGRDLKGRIVGISHLACLDEALALKDQVLARFAPREVVVAPMGAAIGTYAGRGGLIIAG